MDHSETPEEARKENYVRSVLAGPEHLGNSDILAWIEHERTRLKPTIVSMETEQGGFSWQELILGSKIFESRPVEHAEKILTNRCDPEPPETFAGHPDQHLLPLLEALHRGGAMLYWMADVGFDAGFPVIVCGNGPASAAYLFCPQQPGRNPGGPIPLYGAISMRQLAAVALRTWMRDGPKASEARRLLCIWVSEYIRRVRAAANTAFDQAIAIPNDDTEVVCADLVLIRDAAPASPGGVQNPIPAERFGQRRIVFSGGVYRRNIVASEETIQALEKHPDMAGKLTEVLHWSRGWRVPANTRHHLIQVPLGERNWSIFYLDPRFCHTPLFPP